MATTKLSSLIPALLATFSLPYTSIAAHVTTRQLSTTGPYNATTTSLPLLTSHTIYTPLNLSTITGPVPILIWGNNACNTTTSHDPYAALNAELASWGAVVMACGSGVAALHSMAATAEQQAWANVNTAQVGMLGTSCGGVETYTAGEDERVLSLAVLDSRVGSTQESRKMAQNATKPVFFFSTALASPDGVGIGTDGGVEGDFDAIAKGVPSWFGVLPGMDDEMMGEGGAGKMGRAGRFWAQWMVSGNQTGSEFFVDASGAESEGWTVMRKGLDILVL